MTAAPADLKGLGRSLSSAQDLLAKLQFDFGRIKSNPHDVYAAFDFFVTAEHLPEWCDDRDVKRTEPLLRVVSHLATGAKHFTPSPQRHKSVADVGSRTGIFNPAIFNSEVFNTGGLTVVLKGEEIAALGAEIGVLDLARRVLTFWERRLAS